MVIGEFSDSFPPLMDGVGSVMLNYMRNLEKRGDEVYVVTGGYEGYEEYDRIMGWKNVFRLPGRPLERIKPYGILKTPPDLFDRLMAIDFDLIHIHSPFYTGNLGRKIAEAKHIPLVGTFHTLFRDDINMFDHHMKPLTEMVVRYVMRNYQKCDAVWTPSKATRTILMKDYRFSHPVSVMENGCDIPVPSSDELAAMRKRACSYVHEEEATPVFLFIGQHKDSKNIPLILESVLLLKKRGVRFRMLFVGKGPHEERYKAFVKENGLGDSVSFLGMISDRSLISALFSITTLFTFPSMYDTSCLVMREAACFSVPVIFAKGSCTSEDVSDGVNGYIAEGKPEPFSQMMEKAVTDRKRRDAIGQAAHDTLYHSWKDVVGNVEKEYHKIISTSKE